MRRRYTPESGSTAATRQHRPVATGRLAVGVVGEWMLCYHSAGTGRIHAALTPLSSGVGGASTRQAGGSACCSVLPVPATSGQAT